MSYLLFHVGCLVAVMLWIHFGYPGGIAAWTDLDDSIRNSDADPSVINPILDEIRAAETAEGEAESSFAWCAKVLLVALAPLFLMHFLVNRGP